MATLRSFGSTPVTSRPPIRMLPPVTSSSPATMRSSVDLPQPDGPTTTANRRSATVRSTPWITSWASNDLRTSESSICAMPVPPWVGSASLSGFA